MGGGGGGSPIRRDRGITGGVGGEGAVGIPEEGNHWKGQGGQGEKLEGETDGQPGNDRGVHRFGGKPVGTILGINICRVERDGTCAGTQCTQAERLSDTDTGQLGPEIFGRG